MNNQVNVMIAGADMGGLIASCALHYDFQNRLLQKIDSESLVSKRKR